MSFSNQRSPIQPGQQLAGKYRIECEIGSGAMGVVVEAWHIELDQRVAIKFLYPEFASNLDAAERFRREARAVVRIESEHVAKVIDIGVLEQGRVPYYVMEYLRGRDLSRELAAHGPLPANVAVDYMLEACEALAEAHGKGIVHRDLKPANLFLTLRPNGTRMIKVLDFGISKFTGPTSRQFSLTDTSTLMGSPAYMSPEQLESSRDVDGRADIWSLGIILHELILGLVPFRGDTVMQLVRAILAGTRAPLTSRPDVPWGLEEVVVRCLRQDREQRFANIHELREALVPFSSAAAGSRAMSTARGVAPEPPAAPASSSSSSASRVSPLPPAALPSAESHARSPTSWGNTQGGRRWRQVAYRRGLPVVLLAMALVGGGYLGVRFWFGLGAGQGAPGSTLRPVSKASETQSVMSLEGRHEESSPLRGPSRGSQLADRSGRVDVRSTPEGAAVFLDGEPTGLRTPLVLKGLSDGRRLRLRVEKPGFARQEREITVVGGSVEAQAFELIASVGVVHFAGAPAGASIYIDEALADVDDAKPLSLSVGPHTVRVETIGSLIFSGTVVIVAGEQTIRVDGTEGTP